MQIVILAAGSGKRMKSLTTSQHKSLLKLNETDSFLSKLLHQLNEYEISKIVVVTGFMSESIIQVVNQFQLNFEIIYNEKYEQDVNIYSLKLALDRLTPNENTIILEADIILDDLSLKEIYFSSNEDKSIWFTRGKFTSNQYGGILSCTHDGKITDIRIEKRYESRFDEYFKLVGITTISKDHFLTYRSLIAKYSSDSINQYYLIPWIENLNLLPCAMIDLDKKLVTSINTPEEYYEYLNSPTNGKPHVSNYELINIEDLHPIEDYIQERKLLITQKIANDGYWIKPLIIDNEDFLIMDGHHRFEAAKELGLKRIPAIKVNYEDIPIWSLKASEKVTKQLVREKALSGDIYPNKTVKHSFPFEISLCKIPLKILQQ